VTQCQAFLMAFAAGFLLTAIPKRTGTPPASVFEIALLAVLLPAIVVGALLGRIALAEAAYAAVLLTIAQFVLRRFFASGARRRPPASFLLVPLALFMGLAAAPLLGWGMTPSGPAWAIEVGRRFAFEGVFFALAIGIGSFLLPLALRGVPAPDVTDWRSFLDFGAAALALLASFALTFAGATRLGHLLRGAVVATALIGSGALRYPTRPGTNRRLIWLAAVSIPIGPLVAAAFPAHEVAAMHITFAGGFGLLAFGVSAHVILGHTGHDAERSGRPVVVATFGALFVGATIVRALATVLADHYIAWLALAASLWVVAAILWAAFLLPKLWDTPLHAETESANA
jgi:uncharacterized protein involved in response to NO